MYKLSDLKVIKHFSSLSTMVDYCNDTEGKELNGYGESEDETFTDTRNMKHANDLAQSGWIEGVQTMSAQITVAHEGMDSYEGYRSDMDVVGPIPIVGAFCSGDPECMLTPANPDEKPVINMIIDCNMTSAVNKAQTKRRGAAIVALAEKLEEAGRSVAIYASCTARLGFDDEAGTYTVCVKQADAEFNLHSITYALIHPSFYRRHGFRIWELGGFDHSGSIRLLDIDGVDQTIGDIDLYFPCINKVDNFRREFSSQNSTNEYVLRTARESGIIS